MKLIWPQISRKEIDVGALLQFIFNCRFNIILTLVPSKRNMTFFGMPTKGCLKPVSVLVLDVEKIVAGSVLEEMS